LKLIGDRPEGAKQLLGKNVTEIMKLEFGKNDQFRSGMTVGDWIDGEGSDFQSGAVRKQLKSYITGTTIKEIAKKKNVRAFVVVIVGNRQIIMREMGTDGEWIDEFRLA
jgi:hypothetical protein